MRMWIVALCLVASLDVRAASAPRFPSGAIWHQDISAAPVHAESAQMINTLDGLGGFGFGRMQIDFSLHVRQIAAGEHPPRLPLQAHPDDYYLPDCDPLSTLVPVPADAAFEGQDGLACDNENEDCHLLLVEGPILYELYAANLVDGHLQTMCLARWDLTRVYPTQGRGEHCTSADAAGFPIAALLPNADGVAAAVSLPDGDLGHAIRFVLPNARMASDASLGGSSGRLYVRPATHAGGPSGPAASVPYGARLRLRADFNLAGYPPAARVILRTMQRYGMVLADGGNVALTFESDRHTTAKWDDLDIGPHIFWNGTAGDLTPVKVSDFAVIDTGARIPETYDCARTPIEPGQSLFADGFEP